MPKTFATLLILLLACPACSSPPPPPKPAPAEPSQPADPLLETMVRTAEPLLLSASFVPFARILTADGRILPVSAEEMSEPAPPLQRLREAVRREAQSESCQAAALAWEEVAQDAAGMLYDTLAVAIDRRDGSSLVIFFPYRLQEGKVQWSEPFSEPGDKSVFAPEKR